MKLIFLLFIIYSQISLAKNTEWHAGDLPPGSKNESHQMIDIAARAILAEEVTGPCLMRCFTSNLCDDGSYVVTGIYEVLGEKRSDKKKNYIRCSIYIRWTEDITQFFYTTFTEKVDEKKLGEQYEYFKGKILMAKNQLKEPLPQTGGLLTIPTEVAVIEGAVSDAFFVAHIGDNEAKPDFDERDRELLKFLHNSKTPNNNTDWKLCKVVVTITKTKEKPPELDPCPFEDCLK